MNFEEWFEEEPEGEYPLHEYDLTPSPNDFNILTLVSLIDSGVVKIPNFQRNFVWDIKRSSKLIESLIIGLPVPQIFFFEQGKNNYLVIDGQQRLMTIYYFVKGRFPKMEKRNDLRKILDEKGYIPKNFMADDSFFINFNLVLHDGEKVEGYKNKLHRLNYETLLENKTTFDLRTIRSIIVKQTADPKKTGEDEQDDSALYELFNRLNTGGVNLSSQEIRMSLYHSDFMQMLLEINISENWRKLTTPVLDIHLKDVEILLRAISLLIKGDEYIAPLGRFINTFSKKMKQAPDELIQLIRKITLTFLENCNTYNKDIFKVANGKFSSVLFESVYYASSIDAIKEKTTDLKPISEGRIQALQKDETFINYSTKRSTNTVVLKKRLQHAYEFLRS